MTPIDLSRYGTGVFNYRGTLQSQKTGDRLLLLFGERHSLKPFIKDTLLYGTTLGRPEQLPLIPFGKRPKTLPGFAVRESGATAACPAVAR